MPFSRGGRSKATEHGVAACHLRGQSEREAHGLPFTDRLGQSAIKRPYLIVTKPIFQNTNSRLEQCHPILSIFASISQFYIFWIYPFCQVRNKVSINR